jgi:hypothetical protein
MDNMKMKTKILIAASFAALVVPAASFGSGPTGQDRENGARACRALRASMGLDIFRQTYGTVQSNRKNAFGRCVSMWAHAAHQSRISARAACTAEQADPNFAANHNGMSFAEFYGTGPNHKNAFGKCVSSKAKASLEQQQSATKNAARSCKAERSSMEGPAFRAKYGKNANDRNAFGKCVSQLAKSQT